MTKEIVEQDGFLDTDVNSLFANKPLDETIDICTNSIYSQQDVIEVINKKES